MLFEPLKLNCARSALLLGQTKTSLARSWVLRTRKNDDVTQLATPLANGSATDAFSRPATMLPWAPAGSNRVRGKFPLLSLAYIWIARPIWRRLLAHFT